MMRKNVTNGLLAFLLFCTVVPWWGCTVINPHEPTPTYIHIDSFHFVRNSVQYPGITISHKITTVWAYYNNNPIGEFDLPCTIPVVTTGDTGTVELAPGIAIDGLNNDLTAYPFYKLDTFRLPTMPGKIVNHKPVTGFSAGLDILPIAYFDNNPAAFLPWNGTAPLLTVTDDSLVFEGYGSGSILLNADSAIDSSIQVFTIPYGQHSFIEFDYKSDIPFAVGLQSNLSVVSTGQYYLAGLAPSTTWQKIYVNTEAFVTAYQGSNYNLYIKASLPDGVSRGRVLMDNIQRVTFK